MGGSRQRDEYLFLLLCAIVSAFQHTQRHLLQGQTGIAWDDQLFANNDYTNLAKV